MKPTREEIEACDYFGQIAENVPQWYRERLVKAYEAEMCDTETELKKDVIN